MSSKEESSTYVSTLTPDNVSLDTWYATWQAKEEEVKRVFFADAREIMIRPSLELARTLKGVVRTFGENGAPIQISGMALFASGIDRIKSDPKNLVITTSNRVGLRVSGRESKFCLPLFGGMVNDCNITHTDSSGESRRATLKYIGVVLDIGYDFKEKDERKRESMHRFSLEETARLVIEAEKLYRFLVYSKKMRFQTQLEFDGTINYVLGEDQVNYD